jgi:uncharacterized protein YigE (DUF2233 family)
MAPVVALVLATGLVLSGGGDNRAAVAQPSPPCRQMNHEEAAFTVCEVDLRRQAVRLFWQRPDGQTYGYLGALPSVLPQALAPPPIPQTSGQAPAAAKGPPGAPGSGRLQFAMNGGMFHPDYKPVGLYVENGREITRANTRNGPGNFHLKPNGVFYTAGATAGVMETAAYLKAKPAVDFATQSGPMLVINGRIHPRFKSGESQKVRNGVGVRDANTVLFAISDGEVSFGAFARLFRDGLKCPNALFLDGGSAPALYAPALQRSGNFLPLGPMVGVFDKGR